MVINQRLKKQLCQIGHRNERIKEIILFGSRAIGDNEDKSDVDLAFVAPEMPAEEWAAFTFDLEEELDTLLFLDLIKFEDAPDGLKKEITDNGKALYCSESYTGIGNR